MLKIEPISIKTSSTHLNKSILANGLFRSHPNKEQEL